MTIFKIIHPTLGLADQRVTNSHLTEKTLKEQWRFRYGKKYFECTFETEVDGVVVGEVEEKVIQVIEEDEPKVIIPKYKKKKPSGSLMVTKMGRKVSSPACSR